jgi:hypothetical protein
VIKEKELKVLITRRNITFYKNKGYKLNDIDTEYLIKIEDINRNSHQKITAICELCSVETIIKLHKYYDNKNRCGYYGCKKCSRIKFKQTNMKKYGVDNPMKTQEMKDKIENNNIEKYGVKTTLLEKNTKEKIINTNIERYGAKEVLASKEIREKSKKTCLERYGVDSFSKTQQYYESTYKKWKNDSIDKLNRYNINDYTLNKDRTINIKCNNCNEYYNITSKNLYQRYEIQNSLLCTICNPLQKSYSNAELDLLDFIKENYSGKIVQQDKEVLDGKEIDIYLPDINIGFEYNGLFWHCDIFKNKEYHKNKTDNCLNKNIKLIHIWEDDWNYKQEIVKSIILNKLNKTPNKFFARKCELKEIDDNKLIRNFLNNNHLQGFVGSSVKVGLFYNDELMSLMTFGKKRKIMNSKSIVDEWELLRFCNKLNTNIVGGASKLFKYFINNYNPREIISYANKDISSGELYLNLGFNYKSTTVPNYFYFDSNLHRYNRFNFRKDVLVNEGYDINKSEYEIMSERNYHRIYDSGNLKFIYF